MLNKWLCYIIPGKMLRGQGKGRGSVGRVVKIIGGLEPRKSGSVSWFCHQPAEGAQIHSSASLNLFFSLADWETSPLKLLGGLNRIIYAKPVAHHLSCSQLSLNGSCCHYDFCHQNWKYKEKEAGSSQAHMHVGQTTLKGPL